MLLSSRIWALASFACDIYILEAASTSGMRCSLLYEDMSLSTLPSSLSMMERRSLMNSEVLAAIMFLSFTQSSL